MQPYVKSKITSKTEKNVVINEMHFVFQCITSDRTWNMKKNKKKKQFCFCFSVDYNFDNIV